MLGTRDSTDSIKGMEGTYQCWVLGTRKNNTGSKVWRVAVVRDKVYIPVLVTKGRIDSSKVWRVAVRYGEW